MGRCARSRPAPAGVIAAGAKAPHVGKTHRGGQRDQGHEHTCRSQSRSRKEPSAALRWPEQQLGRIPREAAADQGRCRRAPRSVPRAARTRRPSGAVQPAGGDHSRRTSSSRNLISAAAAPPRARQPTSSTVRVAERDRGVIPGEAARGTPVQRQYQGQGGGENDEKSWSAPTAIAGRSAPRSDGEDGICGQRGPGYRPGSPQVRVPAMER